MSNAIHSFIWRIRIVVIDILIVLYHHRNHDIEREV